MNEEIKILVVDDTDSNIDILNSLLNDDYAVLSALDGEFALEVANDDLPDLILLDIVMPDMDGFEVCEKLKQNPKTKDIPIIFITSISDENSIEKAYELGCVDFITKPFKPKELVAKVNREIKLQKLIFDLEKSKEELKLLASTDSLTGLFNRRHFSNVADSILNLSKREKSEISIIMIDIDKFKNVNDTYGHKIGDDVIKTLSKILTNNTRESDIVCRFGGEEFIILLPKTSKENAKIIAEKIRNITQEYTFIINNDEKLNCTISLGVSQIDHNIQNPLESTINKADKALYTAKQNGRNMVCLD